jgi:hypothetical protein
MEDRLSLSETLLNFCQFTLGELGQRKAGVQFLDLRDATGTNQN